jgi:branched-chain amino acid transport system permease protein
LALILREYAISRYGPAALFNVDLRFPDGSSTILTGLFLGTSIQNYWIFMSVIGFIMIFGVQYLLQNTRIGIIIRAGVQDSDMVEALGINVRLIFTLVFALGAAIAALGGAVASGFLAPNPDIGDQFLLQAIAVVIVGGLGSYSGTAVASIVLGITGAIASHFALVEYSSDALGSTSILIILLIVLYIKPTGLFGRAH